MPLKKPALNRSNTNLLGSLNVNLKVIYSRKREVDHFGLYQYMFNSL